MSQPLILALIVLAVAPGPSVAESRIERVEVAQVTLHQRIIIRIPRLPFMRKPVDTGKPLEWSEKKGPKCVAMGDLIGAAISAPDSIDLMVDDGTRGARQARRRLPAARLLFELLPQADARRHGLRRSRRDSIALRGSCRIEEFKRLVAKTKR